MEINRIVGAAKDVFQHTLIQISKAITNRWAALAIPQNMYIVML